jgi:hypothetical protein
LRLARKTSPPEWSRLLLVHDRPVVDWDNGFWGRRAVIQGAMWSLGVVVSPPRLDQDLCFAQAVEDFAVQ